MDEVLRWNQIGARIGEMPRGSRTRLARLLEMDRSQLAKTLRTKNYPTAPQWPIIVGFLNGLSEVAEDAAPVILSSREVDQVPVYGYAAGPEGDRIAFNDGQILDMVTLPRGMTLTSGDFFIVQSLGASMEPRIFAGERRLVHRNEPARRGQDTVIEFQDGTAVIKTYKTERDGRVWAEQYNPPRDVDYDATSVKAYHAVFPL